jgi:hypothetical protein
MAAAAKDEAAMFDLYRMPGALNAKASTRPLGYTGDASTGLYSWSKLGRDDCNMVEWVNDHGSPIYHLTLESTCSLAIITTPPGTTATFMVSQDHHLEAEVDLSQSYGRSLMPKLLTADLERALNASAEWPIWSENPVHVQEFLRRIGRAAWSTFKYTAPHLITAAEMAAAGATPGSVLATLLKQVL